MTTKVELLAPAGNMEKLITAFHFGADAVYLAGKQYGLRAFADNFTIEQIHQATQLAHSLGKKVYVTLNIFANNSDFDNLKQYLNQLQDAQVDAVLVSDIGVFQYVKDNSNLKIHISTQANTTNKYSVEYYYKAGAERVVLARELSLADIKQIHQYVPNCQLETFVHGAMCISYSGRCLLSNYMTGRDSNRGQCVQACRWQYNLSEISRTDDTMTIQEDDRGTYILNSRDLNMISHIDKLIEAGIDSLKIEGRMKSVFYVATVVNAYRRAIDEYYNSDKDYVVSQDIIRELDKASHRKYTTGFFLNDKGEDRQYYESSHAVEESKFLAKVIGYDNGIVTVEQRNKFVNGDVLEILSPTQHHNKTIVATNITDTEGNSVEICNVVQQILRIPCPYPLQSGDILRQPTK